MRNVPKKERKRATVVLCALLTTSACAHQTKKPETPSPSVTQPAPVQLTASPTYNGPLRLHEVRVIEATGQHSVLFRLSRPPEGVDYFPLRNPSRLVIDIKGPIDPLPKVQNYKATDPLVSAVRIGSYQGRMRLVVDLKGNDIPPFSVDNYDTLITAFVGEKSEKQAGKEQAESSAQVLFLADGAKEGHSTQIASGTQKPGGSFTEEKSNLSSSTGSEEKKQQPGGNNTVAQGTNQPDTSTTSKETTKEETASSTHPTATSPTPSQLGKTEAITPLPTEPTQSSLVKNTEPPKQLQEETLSPSSAPPRFAAHQTEEEPWEVEKISQAPASFPKKHNGGHRKVEDVLQATVAREENMPPSTEFKPDRDLLYTGKKISLDFKNADVHDVVRGIRNSDSTFHCAMF